MKRLLLLALCCLGVTLLAHHSKSGRFRSLRFTTLGLRAVCGVVFTRLYPKVQVVRKARKPNPPEIRLDDAKQAGRGLHYAHRHKELLEEVFFESGLVSRIPSANLSHLRQELSSIRYFTWRRGGAA